MAGNHVLVVDDEPDIGRLIQGVAESFGESVTVTFDAQTFKDAYLTQEPDIIFLDVVMPDCDSTELMRFLAEAKSRAIIHVMGGHGLLATVENFCRFESLNIARILEKPVGLAELSALLKPLPLFTGRRVSASSSSRPH